MSSRRAIAAALGALIALPAAAPPAQASAPGLQVRSLSAPGGEDFWTQSRMEAARPLELVRGAGAARLRPEQQAPDFLSAEVTTPTTAPNNTNGRLFGVLKGFGGFSCSATSLDSASGRVIFTAGHCVYDPRQSRFAKKVVFVPAYTDGEAPFGTWQAATLLTTRGWTRDSNSNFDFAAIELRPGPAGETIEGTVGGRPLAVKSPVRQSYAAYGYPANLLEAERMWACGSAYAGRDPRPFRIGAAPIAIGCDMTGGASGGGWIGESGALVSVSSFGYSRYPNLLFGPRLGAAASKLVKRAGG